MPAAVNDVTPYLEKHNLQEQPLFKRKRPSLLSKSNFTNQKKTERTGFSSEKDIVEKRIYQSKIKTKKFVQQLSNSAALDSKAEDISSKLAKRKKILGSMSEFKVSMKQSKLPYLKQANASTAIKQKISSNNLYLGSSSKLTSKQIDTDLQVQGIMSMLDQ